jgi:hypothetical protein
VQQPAEELLAQVEDDPLADALGQVGLRDADHTADDRGADPEADQLKRVTE